MSHDLQSFLKRLKDDHPEQLLEVNEPVSREFEATALVMEAERLPSCPAVVFRNIAGSGFTMAANVLAHRPRLAWAFETTEERMVHEFKERIQRPIPPTVLKDAPWQENSLLHEAADLRQLPILTHFEQDGGPYVTAGLVVARDPQSGMSTVGFHRMQLKGPRKLGVSLHSRRRMFEYFRRGEEKGESLEAAICIGVHPLVSLGALTLPPAGMEKFALQGGLLGRTAGAGALRHRGCQRPPVVGDRHRRADPVRRS